MMYYIFTTEQEALQYDIDVCAKHNYSEGTNWANPKKHPTEDKWAITSSPRVTILNDQEESTSVELTSDWFTDNNI